MRLLFTLLLLLQFVFINAQPVDSTNTKEKIIHFCEGGLIIPSIYNEIYYPKKNLLTNVEEQIVGFYEKKMLGFELDYKLNVNIYKKWNVSIGLGYAFHKVKYDYPRDSVLLYKEDIIERYSLSYYTELLANDKDRAFHEINLPISINYSIWKFDIGIGFYCCYTFFNNYSNSFLSDIYFMPNLSLRYYIGSHRNIPIAVELNENIKIKIGYVF